MNAIITYVFSLREFPQLVPQISETLMLRRHRAEIPLPINLGSIKSRNQSLNIRPGLRRQTKTVRRCYTTVPKNLKKSGFEQLIIRSSPTDFQRINCYRHCGNAPIPYSNELRDYFPSNV